MPRFELGAREAGARFIPWADILRSKSMPEASKDAPKPWAIPVTYRGETYTVEADGEPFGIERVVDGKKRYFFCPGIEADLNTEGLESASFKRSSIVKKFTLYLQIKRQQLYRAHFGFPTMLVPFFTTIAEHLDNMKALLHKMTDGKGSRIILFGEPYPAFNTFRCPLPPSGHALTDSAEHLLAAKEHTVNSLRRTRAHVIITHDLNAKTKMLMQMFRYGVDVHPNACAELAEALADDILRDVGILMDGLEAIKQWVLRQKEKLYHVDEACVSFGTLCEMPTVH